MSRKANALLEYGIIIIIVLGALSAMHYYIKRGIQAKVKHESDVHLWHAIGLEWPEQTFTYGTSDSSFDRYETPGRSGGSRTESEHGRWSVTYSFPVPRRLMKHKQAARSVQDAAVAAPDINYPSLYYAAWNDPNPSHPD